MEIQPAYVRGLAYLRGGAGAEAMAEFQKIIAHRGVVAKHLQTLIEDIHRATASWPVCVSVLLNTLRPQRKLPVLARGAQSQILDSLDLRIAIYDSSRPPICTTMSNHRGNRRRHWLRNRHILWLGNPSMKPNFHLRLRDTTPKHQCR